MYISPDCLYLIERKGGIERVVIHFLVVLRVGTVGSVTGHSLSGAWGGSM